MDLTGINQPAGWAAFLLEALGEILAFLQLLEAACIPWLTAPSSTFKANRVASSNLSDYVPHFPCHMSFCDFPACLFPL